MVIVPSEEEIKITLEIQVLSMSVKYLVQWCRERRDSTSKLGNKQVTTTTKKEAQWLMGLFILETLETAHLLFECVTPAHIPRG